jgi:UDP-glucose 4-epimerase
VATDALTDTGRYEPQPDLIGGALRSRLAGKRIMVTGGAGFIGSHLVERLTETGAVVRVLDDLSTGSRECLTGAIARGLDPGGLVEEDVRSPRAAAALAAWRPQILVHLAAQVSVPNAARAPREDADINIRGTLTMLEAASGAGVPLVVFAASCSMYGQAPADRLPIRETQPLAPGTPYAMSKATALTYMDWFARYRDLRYTALALGNVYGPRQSGQGCGVVARFLDQARHSRACTVYGDGTQTRDFVHVDDVADAFVRACARPPAGLVNIATGVETSVNRVRELVGAAAGRPMPALFADAIAGEPQRVALCVDRAQRLLGWRPAVSLELGVARLVGGRSR